MQIIIWHFVSELEWYFHISSTTTKSEVG